MKKLTIGILAHVDAGKTTLSEAMLYYCKEIRRLGRVDHRDAFLDTNEIERSRGITVFSKQAVLHNGDDIIYLLDTPGHTDFSAEAERVLQVLDYAVLIISGSDGVQNHTKTLWRLLSAYHIPTFIFVNKMDISHYTKAQLTSQLQSELNSCCVAFIDGARSAFYEGAAECDEQLMTEFLNKGELSVASIANAVKQRNLFPCFFGAALKSDGVSTLMKALSELTVKNEYDDKFAATVFKITSDENKNRLTHIKITGGSVKVRDTVGKGENAEKISSIRIYSGAKYKTVDAAYAGDICVLTGLNNTYSGQGLGYASDSPMPMLQPSLTYKVILPEGLDIYKATELFRRLEEEDPMLNVISDSRLKEIHVQMMGDIQPEILKNEFSRRFGYEIEFGIGSIAYKETISEPVIGIGHYEPLRHYAEVHIMLEPLPRGSGMRFASECREDRLDKNWQRLILTHLQEKQHIGVLTGSPITDIKITLLAGRAHLKHTEGGDFRQATYRAVRQALMNAENVLLEPWYSCSISVPSEYTGRVMTDLSHINAEMSAPTVKDDYTEITAFAPVSKLRDYPSKLLSFTSGKGRISMLNDGYRSVDEISAAEIISQTGYDAEGDLENTADSVFCSHGAGFTVKWYDVPNYAHIGTDNKTESGVPDSNTRHESYKSVQASDKELMEIFERTYGKIKRSEHTAMRKPSEIKDKPYKAKPLPEGPEYLLVDGYNIIFAWEELNKKATESLDFARQALINILANYQGFKRCELILVFDAYKVKGNLGEIEQHGGISVVYTKEAETADMYIEKVTRILGKKHRVKVATSDGLEQLIILGGGAVRMSAEELRLEVKEVEKQIGEYLS